MKKDRRDDPYVLCPYFKSKGRDTVFCEGPETGSAIHVAFSTPSLKEDYQRRFCKDCWKGCMVAGMLNRKYNYE